MWLSLRTSRCVGENDCWSLDVMEVLTGPTVLNDFDVVDIMDLM